MALQGTPTTAIQRQSLASNGTAQVRPASFEGTSQFYFQGGHLFLELGGPLVLSFTDGSANAAGTLGIITLGTTAGFSNHIPFSFMRNGRPYEGARVSNAGGVWMRGVAGTAGTVSGWIYGQEVPRQT